MTRQDIAMITNSIGDLELAEEVENALLAYLEEKEMKEKLNKEVQSAMFNLLYSFPGSKLLTDRNPVEFLAHESSNTYFILGDCETKEDVDCKVLEWLSRAAYKTEPYYSDASNRRFHTKMLDGINKYLGTNFTEKDIEIVYTLLGNACDHQKTLEFVRGGFDMSVMKKWKMDLVSSLLQDRIADLERMKFDERYDVLNILCHDVCKKMGSNILSAEFVEAVNDYLETKISGWGFITLPADVQFESQAWEKYKMHDKECEEPER